VPGRRRGARSGRGWDAAPARPRKADRPAAGTARGDGTGWDDSTRWGSAADAPLWGPDEEGAEAPVGAEGPAGGEAPAGAERDAGAVRGGPPRDPAELAREICLRQLATRPRTRAELATALRKRGISDEVAAEVLDRYDEVGLIDDAAFAKAWVSSRHHGRGLARRALAGELRRRGVDSELVGEALEELDGETEAATARVLVDRKLRGIGRAEPDAIFRRLVSMLARKGYPAGLAIKVVKDALTARDDEMSAFMDLVDPDALSDLIGEADDPIR
jgi:regulatory protein